MKKFLDLSYYNNNDYRFPNHLLPKIEKSLVGIQTHYVDLSNSTYGEKVFEQFHKKSDIELVENLINEHGIFFEKFLSSILRHRIQLFFNDEENSKYLIKCCKEYHRKFENNDYSIARIKDDFLDICVFRLQNDALYYKLKKSEQDKSKPRTCAICNNLYIPIKLPDWVYYGSNGNDIICYECPTIKTQSKKEIKRLIRELVDILNFIPNANFHPINYNFSCRVKKEDWVEACKIIFQIGIRVNDTLNSGSIIKKKFGSWFKALVESKVLPNDILETTRGVRCIAKSGNECNSLDEMFIDNWLFKNNIISIKEPLYPIHPVYNKSGKRRADWKVNDYFIEYFGLKGEEGYDIKTKEKLLLAQSLNLKLISIFPSDLNNISEKLNIFIK